MNLAYLAITALNIYTFVILVDCILSWFPIPREGVMGDIVSFFDRVCDPYLDLFRRFIPTIGGAVDISPIAALLVLQLVVSLLQRLL